MLFKKLYKIRSSEFEKQKHIHGAVNRLVKEGFDARVYVTGGKTQGYVFLKKSERAKANEVLAKMGKISINEEPEDISMETVIREFTESRVK